MIWASITAGYLLAAVWMHVVHRHVITTSLGLMICSGLLVQVLASNDLFIGPVEDALVYIDNTSSCHFLVGLCGDRLHTYLLGILASILGPAWGLALGYITFRIHLIIWECSLGYRHNLLILLVLAYTAYQTGNGMGELTYSALAISVAYLTVKQDQMLRAPITTIRQIGALGLTIGASVIAHPGNIFVAAAVFRNLKTAIFALIGFLIILNFAWDYIFAIMSKASALESQSAALDAAAAKLRVSANIGETSYASWLREAGFPHKIIGILAAVAAFTVPLIVPSLNFAGSLLGLLSISVSVACIWLAIRMDGRYQIVAFLAILTCHFVFGISSYTPGVGLRHKIPLFVFLLSIQYFAGAKFQIQTRSKLSAVSPSN